VVTEPSTVRHVEVVALHTDGRLTRPQAARGGIALHGSVVLATHVLACTTHAVTFVIGSVEGGSQVQAICRVGESPGRAATVPR